MHSWILNKVQQYMQENTVKSKTNNPSLHKSINTLMFINRFKNSGKCLVLPVSYKLAVCDSALLSQINIENWIKQAQNINCKLGIAIPELIFQSRDFVGIGENPNPGMPSGLAQYSSGLYYHCLRTLTSEF